MRLAVVLLVLGLVAACGGEPAAKPSPSPTSLAQLKPGGTPLLRVGFCDLVPAAAVRAAVAGTPGPPQQWGNGDLPPGGAAGDLTHELGCAWTAGRNAARAWVFGRPVTAAFGAQVVAEARTRKGCTTTPATFGKPGMTQTCPLGGVGTRVRHAGLFGDTWLTCEVSGAEPASALNRRADAWCLAVTATLTRSG